MIGEHDDPSGFDEAAGVFGQAPTLDTHAAIHQQVLQAYDFRCALTGQKYEATHKGVHPDLRVVAIRPRAAGGPLHVSNFLCLSLDAERAFLLGHVVIGDDFAMVPDLSVMDPELAARLNPDGLLLPRDPLYYPDGAQLAFHRHAMLARR